MRFVTAGGHLLLSRRECLPIRFVEQLTASQTFFHRLQTELLGQREAAALGRHRCIMPDTSWERYFHLR